MNACSQRVGDSITLAVSVFREILLEAKGTIMTIQMCWLRLVVEATG